MGRLETRDHDLVGDGTSPSGTEDRPIGRREQGRDGDRRVLARGGTRTTTPARMRRGPLGARDLAAHVNAACDPAKMIAFLRANPDKAAAWAGVQGITVSDISAFVTDLTPVLLRSDVAVTNHGFADGAATPRHSVLQAGTAVLVDRSGVPRARCMCGNPLTPPSVFTRPRYSGPIWSGFTPGGITIVRPAPTIINLFIIINVENKQIIYRPAGSRCDRDRPAVPQQPPQPQQPVPPVQRAPLLSGVWSLTRTNTSCRNFPEGCGSGPLPIRFSRCTDTRCEVARTDGVWQQAHTITTAIAPATPTPRGGSVGPDREPRRFPPTVSRRRERR